MEHIHRALQENIELISTQVTDLIFELELHPYCHFPREAVMQNSRVVFTSFVDEYIHDNDTYRQYWQKAAIQRANDNVDLTDVLTVMTVAKRIIYRYFTSLLNDDTDTVEQFVQRANDVLMRGVTAFFQKFSEIREGIIRQQAQQIRELATPIIPLYDGILILPLVGTIDQARVTHIMESMLEAIVQYQADLMLVDITGVPVFDTDATYHFIQLARAVRLLGANLVIVGISPDIAQSLVSYEITISDIHICSNLQAGLEYALELRGLKIKPIKE